MSHFHALELPPEQLASCSRRLPQDWTETLPSEAPSDLFEAIGIGYAGLADRKHSERALLHGDLFPDNLIWGDDGQLWLLDWETASIDWPVLDLGFTIVGLAGTAGGRPAQSSVQALLSAYSNASESSPSEEDVDAATQYAAAVLMYHRYHRHAVRFPDAAKAEYWRGLLPFFD